MFSASQVSPSAEIGHQSPTIWFTLLGHNFTMDAILMRLQPGATAGDQEFVGVPDAPLKYFSLEVEGASPLFQTISIILKPF
jgi:hypothetical protein